MAIHIGFFQDPKKAETIGCKTPLELNEEVFKSFRKQRRA